MPCDRNASIHCHSQSCAVYHSSNDSGVDFNMRKHLNNMNAQRVWEEFATHMTTSSKGKAEKCRLHTYVTTTVLDKPWQGTTEQFVLCFNEQFRQVDEVSPTEESLPYTTRLTLLQTAVHNIPELRMVETMEEFITLSSTTPGAMATTSLCSKMPASDMIAVRNLSPLHPLELPTNMTCLLTIMNSPPPPPPPSPQDYSSLCTTYDGIDMPAEEIYQVYTTNRNRPPTVSTLTPRKPLTSPPDGRPNPRRSPG